MTGSFRQGMSSPSACSIYHEYVERIHFFIFWILKKQRYGVTFISGTAELIVFEACFFPPLIVLDCPVMLPEGL